MAFANPVIDISKDPLVVRASRRRAWLRIGMPIFGVVLMIAAILTIAIYEDIANRRGALALSQDVLTTLDARISEQITSYFASASRSLALGRTLAQGEPPGDRRRALVEKFAIGALTVIPQIAAFTVGDADGNFLMIRRNDHGGIDTKSIENAPGARRVQWIRRNIAGDETAREEDPGDDYDPRTRPWYIDALEAGGFIWTDVYVFATGYEPGITVAAPYVSSEGHKFVTGVDVTLANLSHFLGTLKVGETGRAIIIDRDGRVVAAPNAEQLLRDNASKPGGIRVDQIGDAPAAAAFDRFRIEGVGSQTVPVSGKRYLATLSPVSTLAPLHSKWRILIVVPEDEFVGFVDSNSRNALAMSLFVIALAALLAGLLVRQGLRTDRAERRFRERNRAVTRQSDAFERLADDPNLFDPAQNRLPEAVTEAAAEITGAKRVSLWHLLQDNSIAHCADSYQADPPTHSSGAEFDREELREFLDHLSSGAIIETGDADRDQRTNAMHRLLMASSGTRSLLSLPVQRQGRTVGALWVEDGVDTVSSRQPLRILAGLAALGAPTVDREEKSQSASDFLASLSAAPLPVGEQEPEKARSRSADLAVATALGEAFYPEVSVFVLHIEDPASATPGRTLEPDLIDSITCAVQEIAAEQGIPYLKLVGNDIIGAAGFSGADRTAPTRVANTALFGRDRLAGLFHAKGFRPDFRLGIDCGPSIGCLVGQGPRLFNLWGDAVRTAQIMAATAVPGAIQTSEDAYERLREHFRFRPRGIFYLSHIGTARTFLLGGRL